MPKRKPPAAPEVDASAPPAQPDVDVTPAALKRDAVLRHVDSLIPYVRNARTHSGEQVVQLAASIEEFGFTNPVLADDTGVIAGHGRIQAVRLLMTQGRTIKLPDGTPLPPGEVPVLDCNGWSDAKRRAYILADNKLALAAGWDSAMLLAELDSLATDGIDVSLAGFSANEVDAMRNGWETDFAAVDRTLAAADRCRLVITAPIATESALRAALEQAISTSGIADVEIE